jgi:hypothetical protein
MKKKLKRRQGLEAKQEEREDKELKKKIKRRWPKSRRWKC